MDSPWGNTPWQPQLFSADEQVLPMNEGGAAWGQPCVTGTVFFGLHPSTFGCIVVLPTAASVALLMSLLSRHFCAALLALSAATASGGLALAADILSCAQFAHEGAPQPMARSEQRGLERLERINRAVKNTPYSVLFLGDSLTEGWDPV